MNFVHVKGKIFSSILLIAFLLISTNQVNLVAASPETPYFHVDPTEVTGKSIGNTFGINITVTDAPPSYAWEIHISWDPDILQVISKTEGDFLHRGGTYNTKFVSYPSFSEANVEGEIMVGALLYEYQPMTEWASGTGWLCTLAFNVAANGTSVLNLFDTSLNDHMLAGYPSPTYYPNEDGFFYNEPFHNIAITNVTRAQAAELVAINVTVTNKGNYSETSETFNVTVYADTEVYEITYDVTDQPIKNTTVVGDEVTVETKTVTEPLAVGATTTITFTWNTTGVAGGTYTISAEAMGDDDTRDNLFIDGTVAVLAHDIAITNVVASPTEVTVGGNVSISVTVKNEGNFDETFNVTIYYNSTTIETAIETETDIILGSGNSTIITFKWNTTDVAEGTYKIKAEATVVPNEIDTDDNTFTFESVVVRGAAAPDILLYAAVGIVIIVVAAIAVYFIWFRKRT